VFVYLAARSHSHALNEPLFVNVVKKGAGLAADSVFGHQRLTAANMDRNMLVVAISLHHYIRP
jgi:hypothetical protein